MASDIIARALAIKANKTLPAISSADAGKLATVDSNGKWAAANLAVGQGEIAVDSTLLVSGAAADAKATGDKVNELKSAMSAIDTAQSTDVGKALSPKTVTNGKVTEWKYVSTGGGGGGAVDDVQINGTSIVDGEGIANIESDDLDFVTPVSGETPTITAVAGMRYECGEVSTIAITTPATGIVDVIFTSGSTPAVLMVTPPTGMTMKWANGFDPTALEANTVYELNIMNGVYGVVGSWS